MSASMILDNGSLVVVAPYNPALVASIKGLPVAERKWDALRKAWLVAPHHGARVAGWIAQFCNELVMVPQTTVKPVTVLKMLEVKYIGQCKMRDDGQNSAFGYVGNEWAVIFPELTLRAWFENMRDDQPAPAPIGRDTLYQILGISETAGDGDVKPAYRRMARQWHPDVCKEPDATERFQRIQGAYEVLGDATKRKKYDAGLMYERLAAKNDTSPAKVYRALNVAAYRSPLLCGLIMAEGVESLGRFTVSKILEWGDITRGGLTLVTSWPMGAMAPLERWI